MTDPDNARLNPDIQEVKVGIRRLRKIKIYPLSFRDQTGLSDLVTQALQVFFDAKDQEDMAFINTMFKIINKNIERILGIVTDEKDRGDDILSELTNNQIVDISTIIYDVNYQVLAKKVTDLFKMIPGMPEVASPLERSSQPSSGDILSTNSNIFTEGHGETEE